MSLIFAHEFDHGVKSLSMNTGGSISNAVVYVEFIHHNTAISMFIGKVFLEPLIPGGSKLGRPARYSKREIANAIFYLVRSGCAWRMMPHDLPPCRICYHYFSR
ncbi:MAG: transposase [Verrucomicrobia bacterium]|jgi:hypothetical protein|nr:transposase [Verrucomicrobiota bacterium]